MIAFADLLLDKQDLKFTTQRLVVYLILGLPLTPDIIADFGVTSVQHYRALKALLLKHNQDAADAELDADFAKDKALCTMRLRIWGLDQALGSGPQINALMRKYAPAYADRVSFWTIWDELYGHT